MCPACIASTAVMVARAGSMGGILAACIGKFRKFWTRPRLRGTHASGSEPKTQLKRANRLGLFQKTKEMV